MLRERYQRTDLLSLEKKYGGMGVPELQRLRQFEEENSKFKQLVADRSLDKAMLQEVTKKLYSRCANGNWRAGFKTLTVSPNGGLVG